MNPTEIEFRIIFNPATGAINISGPIELQILTVGVLEFCKKIVLDQKPKLVQPATMMPAIKME